MAYFSMVRSMSSGSKLTISYTKTDAETNEVKATFGPRPTLATKMVNDFKKEHGKLTPEFKEDLQRWYNKDKGQSTVKDLLKLLK